MIKFLELREKLNNSFVGLCLFGNDGWVKQRALSTVKQWLGTDEEVSTDMLESPQIADIEYACMSGSLFGGKKLVVVNGFVFPQGKQTQEIKRRLSRLLTASDVDYVVVFDTEVAKTFDGVDGIELVDCNKLDAAGVTKWIAAYCRKQGVDVDPIAARKIAEYCLCDMARVSTETQKLIDYGKADVAAVDLLVHKDVEYAVYDLGKIIASGNVQRALAAYKGLLAQGEDNRALFGLLYNFYRRVYYVKTSTELSEDKVAECLGVKRGAIMFAKDVAAKYKPMQLKRALSAFVAADAKLKAFLDEDEVMTQLVFTLATL